MTDMPDFVMVSEPNADIESAAWSRWHSPSKHHIYLNRNDVYQKFITLQDPYIDEAEHLCRFLNQGYIKFIDEQLDREVLEDFDADA